MEKRIEKEGLPEVLDRILDKGFVVDLKARIGVAGTDLLGIKALTVLTNFDTGNKINLELPTGINKEKFRRASQRCLQCAKKFSGERECPWCGFRSYTLKFKNDDRT